MVSTVNSTKEKSFKCSFCGNSFTKHSLYTNHIKKHLQEISGNKSVLLGFIDKSARKRVQIKTCKKSNATSLNRQNKISGKKSIKASKKKSRKASLGKIGGFPCSECDLSFYHKTKLAGHIITHHGEKPSNVSPLKQGGKQYVRKKTRRKSKHECSQCKKVFSTSTNLENHERTHTGEKPFTCYCGKAFREKTHLVRHTRTHTGEKPHRCDQCMASFSRAESLKTHMKIHTGEKPYQCKVCNKSFIQNSNLTKHIRTHTGEKPYKCSYCSSTFPQHSHLVRHLKTHGIGCTIEGLSEEKTKQCDLCKKFFAPTYISRHMRVHTGEKPYQCSKCGKAFTLRTNLERHEALHSSDNLYKCDQCEKVFLKRHSKKIKSHMKLHAEKNVSQRNIQSKDLPQNEFIEMTGSNANLNEPNNNQLTDFEAIYIREMTNECNLFKQFETREEQVINNETTATREGIKECYQYEQNSTENQTSENQTTNNREVTYECYQYIGSFTTNSTPEILMEKYIQKPKKRKALSEIGKRLNFFQF